VYVFVFVSKRETSVAGLARVVTQELREASAVVVVLHDSELNGRPELLVELLVLLRCVRRGRERAETSDEDEDERTSLSFAAMSCIMAMALRTSFFLMVMRVLSCWRTSRETFSGRSSESTTPRMNIRYVGITLSKSSVMKTRFTYSFRPFICASRKKTKKYQKKKKKKRTERTACLGLHAVEVLRSSLRDVQDRLELDLAQHISQKKKKSEEEEAGARTSPSALKWT
jgi:hypothetical protein